MVLNSALLKDEVGMMRWMFAWMQLRKGSVVLKSLRGGRFSLLEGMRTRCDKMSEKMKKFRTLRRHFPGMGLGQPSCKCRVEWSGKEFGVVSGSTIAAAPLQTHVSSLFTINTAYPNLSFFCLKLCVEA
ncbi:hypothetical protein SDJN03_15765, partial [Cucurbita argyrosperma subsp. sororia]